MSKKMMNALMLITLAWSPIRTLAAPANGFSRQFNTYRAKYSTTTFKTAKAFSSRLRIKPEQVLKRYITEQWLAGNQQSKAIVEGIEAFQESGLSYQQALVKVSDIVGQLTDTLDSIYRQERAGMIATKRSPVASRGLASINGK